MKRQSDTEVNPYLIVRSTKSSAIVFRDFLLTVLCWLLVIALLKDVWILIYDFLKDPIFVLLPLDTPDWQSIWNRLKLFVYVSIVSIAWVLALATYRYNVSRRTHHQFKAWAAHDLHTLADYAEQYGSVAQVPWHSYRHADIHFDSNDEIIGVTERSV